MSETQLILADLDGDKSWRLADYVRRGGYEALRPLLTISLLCSRQRIFVEEAARVFRRG
jgi:NADH:ubiquinone oxidoreductase subunit F (NADH-binding)